MDLDHTLLEIGGSPVTLLHLLLVAGLFALLLLIAAVILSWRAQASRQGDSIAAQRRAAELEYRIAELSGALKSLVDQSQGSQIQLVSTLDERLTDAAQKNIAALSSEMLSLKDILSNKQARGAYGQARMEAIIRDGLPSSAYAFQGSLSNRTRPDCLVSLPDSDIRLVIDAKFPLEAFNALKAATGETELRNAEARLRGDVLKHVKDIAEKYLLPGETHETAIMFVPSESVYAELYEKFEDVIQKAHRARVILASPNVLMLLVQTLQAIFRDARMREQAGLIKVEVTKLLDDVGRLKERVGDLQKHFGAAAGDLEKLNVSADKVIRRGARIESLELQEPEGGVEIVRPKLVERS